MVVVQRDTLAIDLPTFGEDDLADRVPALGDADLARIWERADHYVYSDEHALKLNRAAACSSGKHSRWQRWMCWKALRAICAGSVGG